MKYSKGFMGVGVIIAIIVALGVGGGVVYYATKTPTPSSNIEENNYPPQANQNSTIPPTTTNTQTTTSTKTPVTRTLKDETANWTTYRNDQYGIEFRHPADWKSRVLKEGNIDDIVQVFSPESYSLALKGDTAGQTDQFAVRILYNKSYESSLEGKNITFAGKNAIDGGWQNSAMGGSPLRIIKILIDPLVTIEMSAQSSNTKAIEEKILSTFKFTAQNVSNPTASWKTYTGTQYGFSIQYPAGTQISDVDISGGRSIFFTTSQGIVMVRVVTQAWNNGVLSSPPNCNDTASGADRTNTNINGVNFLTFNMSKDMSGMNSPASATEYCAIRNGVAYKLITKVGYTSGSSNGLDLDKNPTLNSMVASFKLN